MSGIIDYEKLEQPLRTIERVLALHDPEERALILKLVNQRFARDLRERQVQEGLGRLNFRGLAKKFMKDNEKDKGGEV